MKDQYMKVAIFARENNSVAAGTLLTLAGIEAVGRAEHDTTSRKSMIFLVKYRNRGNRVEKIDKTGL